MEEKGDIYAQVLKLVADERRSIGKPAIMKGRLITRLSNAVEAILDYEPAKEEPKK